MDIVGVRIIAEMLNVKPSTIYQWAELGQMPCIKLNGALRFDLGDIKGWVESCKREPVDGYNMFTGKRPRKGGQ